MKKLLTRRAFKQAAKGFVTLPDTGLSARGRHHSPLRWLTGRHFVIGVPYVWLLICFLVPFLIVFKISLADMETANPFGTLLSYVDGAITPVRGKDAGNVVIRNSEYWIGPDVIVSRADKSRFRGFGRNWNLAGRSAEIVKLDWGNQ